MHDPQHRPVAGAAVKFKSATSDWTQTAQTDQDGAFSFSAVPVGDYMVTVTKSGFADDAANGYGGFGFLADSPFSTARSRR